MQMTHPYILEQFAKRQDFIQLHSHFPDFMALRIEW